MYWRRGTLYSARFQRLYDDAAVVYPDVDLGVFRELEVSFDVSRDSDDEASAGL